MQAGELRSASVESLRALAALAVFACHIVTVAHLQSPAWAQDSLLNRALLRTGYGVLLFFSLSGYLLFMPFARRVGDGSRRLDLRRFALNRALRILPLYYVAVVTLLAANAWFAGAQVTGAHWWRFALFAENYSAQTRGTIDGVMWSLAVEIQFYILLPVAGYAMVRAARGGYDRLALLLLGASAAALALRFWLVRGPSALAWDWSLPGSLFFFMPGMLLAVLRLTWDDVRVRLPDVAQRSSAWFLAAGLLWLISLADGRWTNLLAAPASFLLIGACVLPLHPSWAGRTLQWRPLVALGVVSYSFYLWHKPLIEAVHRVTPLGAAALAAVALPIATVVALVSYGMVEAPFLRLRRRWFR